MPDYAETYRHWQRDPEGFWCEAASEIEWTTRPQTVFDPDRTPIARWYTGGQLNTCFNAVDRHVRDGRAEQTALVFDSPVTGVVRSYSFRELRDEVARVAGVLAREGVGRGDRVVIYMPMVPEAVITMLASARLGAVQSVVFGGFGAPELAARITDCAPKVVVCASCGFGPAGPIEYKPLLDRALALVDDPPGRVIVLQRPEAPGTLVPDRDITWDEALDGAEPADCVPVEATDPLYVLYTSGTTGKPKGVVRDNGGHAVALNWSMKAIYGVDAGDTYWAASVIGWVVGHSYIVYGPLLRGCATVVYEGKPVGTPEAGAFWRVCADHGVDALFTAPTAIRAIKREDPDGALMGSYDLGKLRALFLAGERCDPDTLLWAGRHLDRPVIDHWWQTESGWAMAANFAGLGLLPVKAGAAGKPVPGYDIRILDDEGAEVDPGEIGSICVKLPLPPGFAPTLWGNDERFVEAYLSERPGYYLTADAGFFDADGFLSVMGRIDDVINVAGHRLSTGQMEEDLASHGDVAECAVVGVADSFKGQMPMGFVVLNAGAKRPEGAIETELVALVREQIGPVAALKSVTVVDALPKTRSGKILRSTICKIADGEEWSTPATIEDPAVLDTFVQLLAPVGDPG